MTPEQELLREIVKSQRSFWRNFIAGMARGAGFVATFALVIIVLVFIFHLYA